MQDVCEHNIRVSVLMPSAVATPLTLANNPTNFNPDKVMPSEDLAELKGSQLHPWIFIEGSTNP